MFIISWRSIVFIILTQKGVSSFSSCHFEFPTYDSSYPTGQETSVMVLLTPIWCACNYMLRNIKMITSWWTQLTYYELGLGQDAITCPHIDLYPDEKTMMMLQTPWCQYQCEIWVQKSSKHLGMPLLPLEGNLRKIYICRSEESLRESLLYTFAIMLVSSASWGPSFPSSQWIWGQRTN